MQPWFPWALFAALLYGAHQVFTRLAADRIGEGLGGLVVEATATLTILAYIAALAAGGHLDQRFSVDGIQYSVLTGVCVGAGTVAFFVMFQRGAPLSAVPAILAAGAALMAACGVLFFHEALTPARGGGIVLAIAGLWLLRN